MTYRHTDILSHDKSSHGHIVTGQIVTRTYCHRTNRQMDILSQDKSSHGHIVTGQIVTRTYCHVNINHPLPYPPPKNMDLVLPGYYSFLVWISHISAYFGSSLHQFLSNACSRPFFATFSQKLLGTTVFRAKDPSTPMLLQLMCPTNLVPYPLLKRGALIVMKYNCVLNENKVLYLNSIISRNVIFLAPVLLEK